jgi:hypothetical protein
MGQEYLPNANPDNRGARPLEIIFIVEVRNQNIAMLQRPRTGQKIVLDACI